MFKTQSTCVEVEKIVDRELKCYPDVQFDRENVIFFAGIVARIDVDDRYSLFLSCVRDDERLAVQHLSHRAVSQQLPPPEIDAFLAGQLVPLQKSTPLRWYR